MRKPRFAKLYPHLQLVMASGLSDVRTDTGALGMGVWAASACLILRQLRDTRVPVSLSVGLCLVVEVVDLMAFEDCVALRRTVILLLIPVYSLSAHTQGVQSVSFIFVSGPWSGTPSRQHLFIC